jgi:hypothetical protein
VKQLFKGNLVAGFVIKGQVERDKLTKLLINSDAGKIFRLLNMGIERAMKKNHSHEQNTNSYGEWYSHSDKEWPLGSDDRKEFIVLIVQYEKKIDIVNGGFTVFR